MSAACLLVVHMSFLGAASGLMTLKEWPSVCMLANSDPTTGTIWAQMEICNFDEKFNVTGVLSDGSVKGYGTMCLDAGDMSNGTFVAFKPCTGASQQQWRFLPRVASKGLAPADTPPSGQIALGGSSESESAFASGAPRTCLQSQTHYDATMGMRPTLSQKIPLVPCNSSEPLQVWGPQPAPPEDKITISMSALRDVSNACLGLGINGLFGHDIELLDCNADVAGKFWVVERTSKGMVFRSPLEASKCMGLASEFGPMWVFASLVDCSDESTIWTFNEDTGALANTLSALHLYFFEGFLGESNTVFMLNAPTSGWHEKFAIGPSISQVDITDFPSVAIYNIGSCINELGWFDSRGWSCFSYATIEALLAQSQQRCGDDREHWGKTSNTACCICQSPVFLGGSNQSGPPELFVDGTYRDGWAMRAGTVEIQYDSYGPRWAYNRTAGTIASLSMPGSCLLRLSDRTVGVGDCEDGMGWQISWGGDSLSATTLI